MPWMGDGRSGNCSHPSSHLHLHNQKTDELLKAASKRTRKNRVEKCKNTIVAKIL
jgi:hypothetical protein